MIATRFLLRQENQLSRSAASAG